MIKGIIIGESLSERLPEFLLDKVKTNYEHLLGGTQKVKIMILEIEEELLLQSIYVLSRIILPNGFYCHFVKSNEMYVIFNNCICIMEKNNPHAFNQCREIGRLYNIPDNQMRFEEMFEKDHPNEK